MLVLKNNKLNVFLLLTLIVALSTALKTQAQIQANNHKISLPSCDVSISADETYISTKGITYSGNVKVLLGLANLRADKITLIKKKNGQCELVSAH